MRKQSWISLLGLVPLVFAACVGDDPSSSSNGGGTDGSADDGLRPGDDGSAGDSAGGDSPSDQSSGGDADAAVKCGYPGEACCGGSLAPCNQGTACTSGICVVNDVWAVGGFINSSLQGQGQSMHYDGISWTAGPDMPAPGTPYGIFGFSPTEFQVVTDKGKALYYVGGVWRVCGDFACADPMTSAALWSIFGFSPSDFWIGGTNVMYQCDQTKCTAKTSGLPATIIQGSFAGTSSNDLWYSQNDKAFHYNGTTWTTYSGLKARAMWAHAANDVWAGDTGGLQHWDGLAWSSVYTIGGAPPPGTILAMSGSASDDVWVVGETSPTNAAFSAHWDGALWSLVPLPAGATGATSVWSASKKQAFAVGADQIWKWDGTAWAAVTLPAPTHTGGWGVIGGSARPRP